MTNLDATIANKILDHLNAKATLTVTGPVKCRLMTANGTASSNGTELATSAGYTAGGISAQLTASASAEAVSNATAIAWTNMPASTVVGVEIWDSTGTPQRIWWGALTASKTLVAGDSFTIPIGSLALALA